MSDELEVTPEAPEESAAPANEQPEVSESAPDENAPIPEAPKPDRVEKRIARLTWEANEARREAERQRIRAEELEARTKQNTVKDDGPKEEDFATAAEYVKAVAQHTYEQGQKAERERVTREQQEQASAELHRTVQQRLNDFRKVTPDFDEAMEDAAFNTSQLMAQELQESEMGPAILYHFAKNPEEANRIAELKDPRKVAKEVAKIEVRLSTAPAGTKQAQTPTTPPPLRPVAASRQAVQSLGQIDDDAEYFRQRRAQLAGRR